MINSPATQKMDSATKGPKTAAHQQQELSSPFGNNKVSRSRLEHSEMSFAGASTQKNNIQTSNIPKSLSIADLICAGKLIKPIEDDRISLTLQSFDIVDKVWHKHEAEDFF